MSGTVKEVNTELDDNPQLINDTPYEAGWFLKIEMSNRDELGRVFTHWRAALPVGVLSLAGSAGWAVAVTLTNAAKVRTLGQVELVIAFAISAWWLHERHERSEYLASALVLVGVSGVAVFG